MQLFEDIFRPKGLDEAILITGGLSRTTKMPCPSYSLPAWTCITGSKLQEIEGTTCDQCYALRGNYLTPNVQKAMVYRETRIDDPRWLGSMVFLIRDVYALKYFRWHDSGDLQSIEHLHKICKIATMCPETKFWLPTIEYDLVEKYFEQGNIRPENLTIRLSSIMIDGEQPVYLANQFGLCVSGVSRHEFTCPASQQDNKCNRCRKCWDAKEFCVIYKKH